MSYCPTDDRSKKEENNTFDLNDDDQSRRMKSSWLQSLFSFFTSTNIRSLQRNRKVVNLLRSTILGLIVVYWYRKRRNFELQQLLPVSITSLFFPKLYPYSNARDEPLSTLYQALKSGSITKAVLLTSNSAIAYQISGNWKRSFIPSTQIQSSLVEQLVSTGANVSSKPDSILSQISTPLTISIPFIYLGLLYKMFRHLNGENDAAKTHENLPITTTFANVAALDHVLEDLNEVVIFLRDPSTFNFLGARPPNGVLLYGPPGTGKTLLARAMAGEVGDCSFIACSGSDFVDMYVGRGANRVRKLFEKARQSRRCILFVDELDALGKSRSGGLCSGSNEERDHTLNQLLTELDGFNQHPMHTLIFLGATNRAELLDPALLRRMDRQIFIGLPDQMGRQGILLIHAERVKCDIAIDWTYLATQTTDFSGANLATVVNEAALLAVRERSLTVRQHHLVRSISKIQMMKRALSGMGMGGSIPY